MAWNFSEIPDWPRLRRRYEAFWRGEVVDDLILVHIQNPNPDHTPPEPWMLEATESKYLDPERFYRFMRWRRLSLNHHTDLFRYEIPTPGPNMFSGYCGGRLVYGANTVWQEPAIASLDEADKIHFDEDNRHWRALLESIAYHNENLSGRHFLGMPDMGGPTDWISCLMGTEPFLIACAEEPDRMRDFALRLARECNRAFALAAALIRPFHDGSIDWMPVWHPGTVGTPQDDMAVNFSPGMYAEIFMPALRLLAEPADATVLHWHDACTQHAGTMAGEAAIDMIQYGHDPNTGPFRDRVETMRQFQAAGKKMMISCVESEDVEFFMERLDPRGLTMIVNTANDEASRRMEDDLRRWTIRAL